jgi:superoxide dismutase, Fe-Mn family
MNSRREFLSKTTKTGLVMGLVGTGLLTTSQAEAKGSPSGLFLTGFSQTPLAYDFGALQPIIDAKTMEIHYTKHAAAYATNLNEAAQAENVDRTKPLEEVLRSISKFSTKMRNNGGGHYNHELFWKIMSPNSGGQPGGKLAEAISKNFGSFEAFVSKFEDAAKTRFGSGWAWLVVTPDHQLVVSSTPNQDNPLMDVAEVKGTPILGIDVWEHAYYLKYQNRRPDYVSAFWKVVNWSAVTDRFASAIG